jgi:hypothetical protein
LWRAKKTSRCPFECLYLKYWLWYLNTTTNILYVIPVHLHLVKKVIGDPYFPGLTLKTILNWNLYSNQCTLYIAIETLLRHYYIYSISCTEITQSVCSYVSELRNLVIGSYLCVTSYAASLPIVLRYPLSSGTELAIFVFFILLLFGL